MSPFQPLLRILVVHTEPGFPNEVEDALSPPAPGLFSVCPLTVSDLMGGKSVSSEECDAVIYRAPPSTVERDDVFDKCMKAYADLPVLVVSGSDDPALAARCIQAGAQDFFVWEAGGGEVLWRAVRHAVERFRQLSELRFALASEKILMEELDVKNKELVELSITDGLTGLYNHRFLQERFDFEYKRARRYGHALSCLMIDIDHFKSVNDTYGHQFGDYVLAELAHILKKKSREVDICGRYGGEEFMVVSSVTAEEALKFAGKLNAAVDAHRFTQGNQTRHITVSIGVSEFRPDIKTRYELIERADTAMYWAKRDGRNLIRLWKEVEEQGTEALDHLGIAGMKSEFMRISGEIRATYIESTNALVRAIDAKDHYTREHSQNVAAYAVALAQALGLGEKDVEVIRTAGLLHDIGKIGVSQEILTNENPLTDEEMAVLRRHPTIGAEILRDIKFLEKEIPVILHHHERYDGKGYPHGLRGREIPVGARVLALVDAFDAMTTARVYRRQLSRDEAVTELRAGRGTQFDPDCVDAFITTCACSVLRENRQEDES